MTGFDSKRKAAQDKLKQWDNEAFNDWWDSDYDDSTNPYEKDTFAYWAWAGWQAALAQPAQEPVAFSAEIVADVNGMLSTKWADWWIPNEGDKLYTAPPQRTELQILTAAKEREACANKVQDWNTALTDQIAAEIRARGEA